MSNFFIFQWLGDSAFNNCNQLTKIDIPNVTTIGAGVFTYCAFEEIYLPNVTSIGNYVFEGMTELRRVTFEKPLTEIGKDIFHSIGDFYKVDTTQMDLVVASGQKNFTGDNTNGWIIAE